MRRCALAETQGRHGQMRCSRGRSIRLVARAEKVAKLWLRDFERCQSVNIAATQSSGPCGEEATKPLTPECCAARIPCGRRHSPIAPVGLRRCHRALRRYGYTSPGWRIVLQAVRRGNVQGGQRNHTDVGWLVHHEAHQVRGVCERGSARVYTRPDSRLSSHPRRQGRAHQEPRPKVASQRRSSARATTRLYQRDSQVPSSWRGAQKGKVG